MRLVDTNVVGQCHEDGTVWNRLSGFADSGLWPGGDIPSMPVSRPFKLVEYSISDDGRTIRVYPRVPPRSKAWILVRCPVMPDFEDGEWLVDDVCAAIMIQWALYRAKMVDGENNAAIAAVANGHRDMALALMGSNPAEAEPKGRAK